MEERKIYEFNIDGHKFDIEIEHENKPEFTKWLEVIVNVMDVENGIIKLEYVKDLKILNRDNEIIGTRETIIVKRNSSLQIIDVSGDSHYGMIKDVLEYLEKEQTWAYDYNATEKTIHVF